MSFLKIKKNIIIIISLISAILFSTIAVLIANLVNMKNDVQTQNVKAVYHFDNTTAALGDDEDWSYDIFYISTPTGLINFSRSVANGCAFGDKIVYLSDNINMRGINWKPIGANMEDETLNSTSIRYPFNGTFDGQNFTVSNLTTTIDDSPRGDHFYIGFFSILGTYAKVENLRIRGFTMNLTQNHGYAYVGAIAGWAISEFDNVQINNCIVDGFTINSVVTSSDYAGIVGWADAGTTAVDTYELTMTNILLKDFTTNVSSSNVYAVCSTAIYKITNYVLQGVTAELNTNKPGSTNNGWDHSNKSFETDDTIRSSTGGTSGTVWYQYESYNDGYPYLREFIIWQKLLVKPANTAECSVSASGVYIPSDAVIPYSTITGAISTSETLDIYGHSVVATPKTHYKMSHWIYSSSVKTYYAYMEIITFKISFIDCSNTKTTLTDMQFGTQYNINSGNEITIEYVAYREDCYSSITLSFYDPDIEGRRSVQYEAINGYYLVAPSLKNQTDYVDYGEKGYYKVTANVLNITPSTELKTYDPEFNQ